MAVAGCSSTAGLSEASTEFDLADLKPFLMRIAPQLEGLSEAEIDRLVSEAAALQLDATRTYSYEVSFQGQTVPLEIEVFADDTETFGLYFFTSKEAADFISEEMTAYYEEP